MAAFIKFYGKVSIFEIVFEIIRRAGIRPIEKNRIL